MTDVVTPLFTCDDHVAEGVFRHLSRNDSRLLLRMRANYRAEVTDGVPQHALRVRREYDYKTRLASELDMSLTMHALLTTPQPDKEGDEYYGWTWEECFADLAANMTMDDVRGMTGSDVLDLTANLIVMGSRVDLLGQWKEWYRNMGIDAGVRMLTDEIVDRSESSTEAFVYAMTCFPGEHDHTDAQLMWRVETFLLHPTYNKSARLMSGILSDAQGLAKLFAFIPHHNRARLLRTAFKHITEHDIRVKWIGLPRIHHSGSKDELVDVLDVIDEHADFLEGYILYVFDESYLGDSRVAGLVDHINKYRRDPIIEGV